MRLILWLLFHIAAPLIMEVRVTKWRCWKGTLFREGSRRAEGTENCFQIILCYGMRMPLAVLSAVVNKHLTLLTWSLSVGLFSSFSLSFLWCCEEQCLCNALCALWLASGGAESLLCGKAA